MGDDEFEVDVSYIHNSNHLTDDLCARLRKILVQDKAPVSTEVHGFVCYVFTGDPVNDERNLYTVAGGACRPNDDVVMRGLRLLTGE